jgi:uncharacterized membrane protein
MTQGGHLWAVGYADVGRAERVRQEIIRLGATRCLTVLDTAVAVRHPDGTVTLDGEPLVAPTPFGGRTLAGLLAALALGAPPLTGAAAGALARGAGGVATEVGIDDEFIREVGALMGPGTSALFVLDVESDMGAILQGIRGLGGAVLRTNVDVERATLIESTLAAPRTETGGRP